MILSVLKRTTRWRILTISRGYKRFTLHTGGLPNGVLWLLTQAITSHCFDDDLGGGEFCFRGAHGWHLWHWNPEKLDPRDTPPEQITRRAEQIPQFTLPGCHNRRERASQEKKGGRRNKWSESHRVLEFFHQPNRTVPNVSAVSSSAPLLHWLTQGADLVALLTNADLDKVSHAEPKTALHQPND